MESEKKLAKILNINSETTANMTVNERVHLAQNAYQWRLMIYFDCISDFPVALTGSENQIMLKYDLGGHDSVDDAWKIDVLGKTNSIGFRTNFKMNVGVNKVKVHYFYSPTLDIDEFLKETEISVNLANNSDQKIFAKGSSSILSTFRRQFEENLCLR